MRARPREICDSSRLPRTASVSIERLSAIFLMNRLQSGCWTSRCWFLSPASPELSCYSCSPALISTCGAGASLRTLRGPPGSRESRVFQDPRLIESLLSYILLVESKVMQLKVMKVEIDGKWMKICFTKCINNMFVTSQLRLKSIWIDMSATRCIMGN